MARVATNMRWHNFCLIQAVFSFGSQQGGSGRDTHSSSNLFDLHRKKMRKASQPVWAARLMLFICEYEKTRKVCSSSVSSRGFLCSLCKIFVVARKLQQLQWRCTSHIWTFFAAQGSSCVKRWNIVSKYETICFSYLQKNWIFASFETNTCEGGI